LAISDYQIEANSRRCATTGKELQPGERCFTALFDQAGHLVRRDYCHEAWQGPPADSFSFWSGRVPPADDHGRPRIDDDALMECFLRLQGQTQSDRVKFRYVVTLLLMRRRRVKWQRTRPGHDSEVMVVKCSKTADVHEVVNPRMTDEDIESVQQEVVRVLGWE
jgi:hypothetical protein